MKTFFYAFLVLCLTRPAVGFAATIGCEISELEPKSNELVFVSQLLLPKYKKEWKEIMLNSLYIKNLSAKIECMSQYISEDTEYSFMACRILDQNGNHVAKAGGAGALVFNTVLRNNFGATLFSVLCSSRPLSD